MLRLLVLTAVVAAAAAQYGSYPSWNSGWGSGYGSPLSYSAGPAQLGYSAGLGYSAAPAQLGYSAGYAHLGYSAAPAQLGYSAGYAPLSYAAPPVAAADAPYSYSRRYRTQDEAGRATYGHEEATQNQAAVRDAAGNVAGSYNYINPDGKLITVKYTAGVDGFQVESNALPIAPVFNGQPPVDTGVAPVFTGVAPEPVQATAEVQEATEQHLAAVAEAQQLAEQSDHQPMAAEEEDQEEMMMEQERRKRSLLYAAGSVLAAPAAGYAAEKTEVILNPGHATAYRIEPVM